MVVMEVTVTDRDLLNLPEYVDELMENCTVKDAGYLKFNIDESCGSGTPLEEFICKFRNALGLGALLKKLHPISVPHTKDIYGHISIESQYLSGEDVAGFEEEMKNPLSYTVASENCCMTALESGVDSLLKHYFDCELPSHSKLPPQYRPHQKLQKLKLSAAAKKRHFSKIKNELLSLTEYEQGKKLQKILDSPKMKIAEQKLVENCPCSQCVYTDEMYALTSSDEQGNREISMEVDLVATANYYNKGFFYASGINVESKDRNLMTSNFSLSYLKLISITSLLEGYFPGINSPYLYAGGMHSFFPVHIEDLSLFSVNFLHHGYPKLWVVIPPCAVGRLTFTLLKEVNHSGLCLGILSHKYHLLTPTWLETHGIPFNVIQRSGQGVIVTPNAAHFGFNLGPNIAEAANFGTVSWIPYGIVHPSCTCLPGQVHADLGPIVQSYCPDMLSDYRQRQIPKVPNNTDFNKHVVHPEFNKAIEILTGSIDDEKRKRINDTDTDGEDSDPILKTPVNVRKMKIRRNRKIILCPLCDKHYEGGHKMRLINHIKESHSNLGAEEKERVESILNGMFPVRGNKLPKVTCKICGKDLAGLSSLKRHQTNKGCMGK